MVIVPPCLRGTHSQHNCVMESDRASLKAMTADTLASRVQPKQNSTKKRSWLRRYGFIWGSNCLNRVVPYSVNEATAALTLESGTRCPQRDTPGSTAFGRYAASIGRPSPRIVRRRRNDPGHAEEGTMEAAAWRL